VTTDTSPTAASTTTARPGDPAAAETIEAPRTAKLDTVEVAAASPEKEQPYAALGLKPDEYELFRNLL
jgi:phosphoribosylformylglycinamidine synthase